MYFSTAEELGKIIGTNGHSLIYGGANVGLMEQVAKTVREYSGTIIGIIPQKIYDHNLFSDHPDELIVTETLGERKALMREKADAFIALPGGFGTLEEILEVITLKQLDYHRKPIVFININHYFDDLFAQFEKSYDELFAKESYKSLFISVTTPKEAMNHILNYKPVELESKWFKVPGK